MAQKPSGKIFSIRELEVRNRFVLCRLDLNIPSIQDDHRVREALPTVKYLIDQGARVVITSHLGRPKGGPDPKYSLEPVAAHLADLLKIDVTFLPDCVGEGNALILKSVPSGGVAVLENSRFYAEEEKNDPLFAQKLVRGMDIYVTDAFGTTHRKHASTYGAAELMPKKGMGFLIEKELMFLDRLLNSPQKPFYVLLGGSKVSDKIKTIENLLQRVQGVAIGGAMAFAFWKADGRALPEGAKAPSDEDVRYAKEILKDAQARDVKVLLPEDFADSFDIGPRSIEAFKKFLAPAATLFWNGPVGMFEKPPYDMGTVELAHFIGDLKALKVVGGGDTVTAVEHAKCKDKFDHLSTGGGAVLEYLEGNGLPGIDVLRVYEKRLREPKPFRTE